jgi:hypothetical protein
MEIVLTHNAPSSSGYYLCKTELEGTPHLVLVVFGLEDKPQILLEGKKLLHKDFPNHFFWSDVIKF